MSIDDAENQTSVRERQRCTVLVTLGVCVAIVHLIRTLAARKSAEFTATRLILARYLALALEFELIWRWKAAELAKRKEREVSQNLPQEYAAYKARVPTFIPRFGPKTHAKEARW